MIYVNKKFKIVINMILMIFMYVHNVLQHIEFLIQMNMIYVN